MKRLLPASALLLLIIIMCISSNRMISHSVSNVKEKIKDCREYYESSQFEKAAECADSFNDLWEKEKRILSFYSNHSNLDDITYLAAILPYAISSHNSFELYSATSRIITILDTVRAEQKLTLQNLY